MQTTDKSRLTAMVDPAVDKCLRVFAATHGKTLSEVTEAALVFCLENTVFIEGLPKVKS
jgi:hypothetical protein